MEITAIGLGVSAGAIAGLAGFGMAKFISSGNAPLAAFRTAEKWLALRSCFQAIKDRTCGPDQEANQNLALDRARFQEEWSSSLVNVAREMQRFDYYPLFVSMAGGALISYINSNFYMAGFFCGNAITVFDAGRTAYLAILRERHFISV